MSLFLEHFGYLAHHIHPLMKWIGELNSIQPY